jgi:hypothetical protein
MLMYVSKDDVARLRKLLIVPSDSFRLDAVMDLGKSSSMATHGGDDDDDDDTASTMSGSTTSREALSSSEAKPGALTKYLIEEGLLEAPDNLSNEEFGVRVARCLLACQVIAKKPVIDMMKISQEHNVDWEQGAVILFCDMVRDMTLVKTLGDLEASPINAEVEHNFKLPIDVLLGVLLICDREIGTCEPQSSKGVLDASDYPSRTVQAFWNLQLKQRGDEIDKGHETMVALIDMLASEDPTTIFSSARTLANKSGLGDEEATKSAARSNLLMSGGFFGSRRPDPIPFADVAANFALLGRPNKKAKGKPKVKGARHLPELLSDCNGYWLKVLMPGTNLPDKYADKYPDKKHLLRAIRKFEHELKWTQLPDEEKEEPRRAVLKELLVLEAEYPREVCMGSNSMSMRSLCLMPRCAASIALLLHDSILPLRHFVAAWLAACFAGTQS